MITGRKVVTSIISGDFEVDAHLYTVVRVYALELITNVPFR